jgi:hypothetical protein
VYNKRATKDTNVNRPNFPTLLSTPFIHKTQTQKGKTNKLTLTIQTQIKKRKINKRDCLFTDL